MKIHCTLRSRATFRTLTEIVIEKPDFKMTADNPFPASVPATAFFCQTEAYLTYEVAPAFGDLGTPERRAE